MRRRILPLYCLISASVACSSSITSGTGSSSGGTSTGSSWGGGSSGGSSSSGSSSSGSTGSSNPGGNPGGSNPGGSSGGNMGSTDTAISPSRSTLAVTGTQGGALADGAETVLLTVTLLSDAGAPVHGASVVFHVSGTGNRVGPPQASDANGVISVALASTHGETKTVSATASNGAGSVPLTATASASFVPLSITLHGPPGTVVADGNAVASLNAVVTRAGGGPPVLGAKVQWSVSGTRNALIAHGLTNASGVLTATLASAAEETKTVTASAGDATSQAQLPFVGSDACYGSAALAGLPWIATASGINGVRVELVDMDGDGVLDLVEMPQGGDSVNVHSGLGTGLFAPALSYDASAFFSDSNRLVDFAVADLNADGALDVLALNNTSLVAFLGDGLGSFADPIVSEVPGETNGFAVADLTGDGRIDAAIFGNQSVDILEGDGHGAFASMSGDGNAFVFNDDDSVAAMTTADLNGGAAGLVFVINNAAGSSVAPLTNDGNGVLSAAPRLPMADDTGPGTNTAIAVAHLNADAHADVVVAGGNVYTFLGDGAGHLAAGQVLNSNNVYLSAVAVVADVNGDSHDDVLTLGLPMDLGVNASPYIYSALMTGRGDGTLAAPALRPTPALTSDWRVADVNGDGVKDVVYVVPTASSIGVNLGRPGDALAPGGYTLALPSLEPTSAQGLATADFNGDGASDLLVQNSNQLVVLLNRAGPAVADANAFVPGPALAGLPDAPGAIATADFTGDGNQDFVVADTENAQALLMTGQGNATFTASQLPSLDDVGTSFTVADLNGDQRPDLVVTLADTNTLNILLNGAGGVFQSSTLIDAGGVASTNVQVADVNGDHKVDILLTVGSLLKVALGDGAGGFVVQPNGLDLRGTGGASQWTPSWILAQDLDGDHLIDVLVSGEVIDSNGNHDSAAAFVGLTGAGDGNFVPGTPFGSSYGYMGIPVLADVNRDGISDLVVPNFLDYLEIFSGHADGSFDPPNYYDSAQIMPLNVVVHDFNGDGLADLALRSLHGARVSFNAGCQAPGQPPVVRDSCSAAPAGAWALLAVGSLLARAARRRRRA